MPRARILQPHAATTTALARALGRERGELKTTLAEEVALRPSRDPGPAADRGAALLSVVEVRAERASKTTSDRWSRRSPRDRHETCPQIRFDPGELNRLLQLDRE